MYIIDAQDTVVEILDVPQSSIGAPCPMILAGEHHLHLAYFTEDGSPGWDGTTVRIVGEGSEGEHVALVAFAGVYAHMFGPPNDEALGGHPLASRGLQPYSVNEIHGSSWVRSLERMNSVHPYHRPESFSRYRHFVFAFHDTTFECIAESFTVTVHCGSVAGVLKGGFQQ